MLDFANIHKPWCFWSWNDEICEDEIRSQMAGFAEDRFGSLVIHARAGLDIPYMGERWFEMWELAAKEAERLGLSLWIYDEDGWPSGFAGGAVAEGGQRFWLQKLRFGQGFSKEDEPVAAFRPRSGGGYTSIPVSEADKDCLCFHTVREKTYVNLLEPDAVSKFIACTHERYKQRLGQYFGNVISGIFTDEPQLSADYFPWSDSLPELFLAEYGYSLTDSLWMLARQEGEYQHIRRDYWMLVQKLFCRSYTKQVADWCDKNNLVFTGHFSAEDGLCDQIGANAGVMPHYAQMQLPGIDHLGNRRAPALVMKQASSVSAQLRKIGVLSESFGCCGWDVSFSDLAKIWNWQTVLGVTTPCFHLSSYSIRGRRKYDYPAFFSYQEPWWDEFKLFSQWVVGLNELLGEGERIAEILVLSPAAYVMSEFECASFERAEIKRISASYRLLIENLMDTQLDFEIGDETLISSYGDIRDGRFYIGARGYSVVIVPFSPVYSHKTMSLLSEFAKNGGKVVCVDSRPESTPFLKECKVIPNRRGMFEKWARAEHISRPSELLDADGQRPAGGFFLQTRRLENGLRLQIWNPLVSGEIQCRLSVEGKRTLYRQNPLNRSRTPIYSQFDSKTQRTEALLRLSAGECPVIDAEDGFKEQIARNCEYIGEFIAEPDEILLTDPNCFTVDYARFALINNGIQETFSPETPTVFVAQKMYEALSEQNDFKDCSVAVEYRFECAEGVSELCGMTVAFEDKNCYKAELNGNLLSCRKGFVVDKAIGEYAIDGMVKTGENRLTLWYSVGRQTRKVNLDECYETERNRFFFPTEPDSIYIFGPFSVNAQNTEKHFGYTSASGFVLGTMREKPNYSDITTQGRWFYRGSAEYKFHLSKPKHGKKISVLLKNYAGCAATWEINGHSGLFMPPNEQDLTEFMSDCDNILTLHLSGGNRNMLGPHHHKKGAVKFTGPSTFKGEWGFEDYVAGHFDLKETWTDEYSFVPFGIFEVVFREYKDNLK